MRSPRNIKIRIKELWCGNLESWNNEKRPWRNRCEIMRGKCWSKKNCRKFVKLKNCIWILNTQRNSFWLHSIILSTFFWILWLLMISNYCKNHQKRDLKCYSEQFLLLQEKAICWVVKVIMDWSVNWDGPSSGTVEYLAVRWYQP